MKKYLLLLISLLLAIEVFAEEATLPGKKVNITIKDYSDIYPAVWFSPNDGSISGLIDKSENPPKPKFKIWIEPQDPEINGIGTFILLGHGEDAYNKATVKTKGKSKHCLLGDDLLGEKPVFLFKDKQNTWVFIILSLNKKAKSILFVWRKL